MKYLHKVLLSNINRLQLTGFAIANFIGLLIILTALQLYWDIKPLFLASKNNIASKDYLTLTPMVNLFNAFGGAKFSKEEIEELSKQDFVKNATPYLSAKYEVYGGIKSGKLNMGTDLFFEALPDEFIDVDLSDWKYNKGDIRIPIIIPRNYLNLYNFGFAEARNLPKMSEDMIGAIPLDITLYHGKSRQKFTGNIVGFSDKINTILVPWTFMEWSNEKFGKKDSGGYSRIMIEVQDASDPQIAKYLESKGYKIEGDKGVMSKASNALRIMMSIIVLVGIVISSLAIFVFILSLYLLLEKNMDKIKKLRLLGYSKNQVCRPYEILIFGINFTITIITLICVFIIRSIYGSYIVKSFGEFSQKGSFAIIAIAVLVFIFFSIFSVMIMRRKVK